MCTNLHPMKASIGFLLSWINRRKLIVGPQCSTGIIRAQLKGDSGTLLESEALKRLVLCQVFVSYLQYLASASASKEERA